MAIDEERLYISPIPIKPWRKLLWVQQPYPDNYVDSSFLSQLKRNSNVQQYSFWTLAADSSIILVHLSTIVIFSIAFLGIYNRGWNPVWFAIAGTVLCILGYGLYDYSENKTYKDSSSNLSTSLKSAILILFIILALSPVLKSLTLSTSSDSIWSLSCWLCLLNICFYDYSFLSKKEFKPMLSTNLALSAAIVLASRLPTTLSVFCFVLFSIQLFGVFPAFAMWIRSTSNGKKKKIGNGNGLESKKGHWILLATVLAVSYCGLFIIGGIWAVVVWLIVQLSISLLFPAWLIRFQKYKNEIQGPWDPAKPVIKSKT